MVAKANKQRCLASSARQLLGVFSSQMWLNTEKERRECQEKLLHISTLTRRGLNRLLDCVEE